MAELLDHPPDHRGESLAHFVAASRLGEVLEVLGHDSVRLLKNDVEGYELEVFLGLDWSSRFRFSARLGGVHGSGSHDVADRKKVPRVSTRPRLHSVRGRR